MTAYRLGVLGSMVWDRIHARDGRSLPVEEWGGITYALAAAAAARPADWTVVPIIKVGRDLSEPAYRFLGTLAGFDLDAGIRVVDAPNNRVELRYQDSERRTERLTGGVPPWTWAELEPIVRNIDALYINFISGFELDLATAQQLRLSFDGPIYADLHSIFLGIGPDGTRVPRPFASWREWLRCFDVVQVNEDELIMLAGAWGGDPWRFAAEMVGDDLRLLLVTLGQRGSAYVASPSLVDAPMSWRARGIQRPALVRTGGATRTEHIAVRGGALEGDPTGCGDVWGATCCIQLFTGRPLTAAIAAANEAAARNVQHRGATGLDLHLSGKLGT